MQSRVSLVAALLLIVLAVSPSWAASSTVRDGSTLQLGNMTYRLDGIDAPPVDQLCIDEHADSWTCGIEARDQLIKLIGGRQVRCDDLGIDPSYKKRHLGVCRIEGDPTSLSQLLVRQGFALNVEASATGRFKADEARAKDDRQGLWKGCFVAPAEFRHGRRGRRPSRGIVPRRPGPRNSCSAIPGEFRHAGRLQHQGQVRRPRPRHR